jgi:hypothetical protein
MNLHSTKHHTILADFFHQTAFSRRKVRELPWQLMASDNLEKLYNLYSDLPFFHLAWRTDRYETREFWTKIEKNSNYSPALAYQSLIKNPTDENISYYEDIMIRQHCRFVFITKQSYFLSSKKRISRQIFFSKQKK